MQNKVARNRTSKRRVNGSKVNENQKKTGLNQNDNKEKWIKIKTKETDPKYPKRQWARMKERNRMDKKTHENTKEKTRNNSMQHNLTINYRDKSRTRKGSLQWKTKETENKDKKQQKKKRKKRKTEENNRNKPKNKRKRDQHKWKKTKHWSINERYSIKKWKRVDFLRDKSDKSDKRRSVLVTSHVSHVREQLRHFRKRKNLWKTKNGFFELNKVFQGEGCPDTVTTHRGRGAGRRIKNKKRSKKNNLGYSANTIYYATKAMKVYGIQSRTEVLQYEVTQTEPGNR